MQTNKYTPGWHQVITRWTILKLLTPWSSKRTRLLDLPQELLSEISYYVDLIYQRPGQTYYYRLKALRTLRLVCHRLKDVATPILFARIPFNFHIIDTSVPLYQSVDHLWSIHCGTSPACLHTKRLRIACVDTLMNVDGNSSHLARLIDYATSVREFVLGSYMSAVGLLQNLRAISWAIHADQADLHAFVEVLAALPLLDELELDFIDPLPQGRLWLPDFGQIRGLRRLKISAPEFENVPQYLQDTIYDLMALRKTLH